MNSSVLNAIDYYSSKLTAIPEPEGQLFQACCDRTKSLLLPSDPCTKSNVSNDHTTDSPGYREDVNSSDRNHPDTCKRAKRDPSSGALFECGVLRDLLWERIHTGHWKDVPLLFRVLYRAVSMMEASLTENTKAALSLCDMGLILGAPLAQEEFAQQLAEQLQSHLREGGSRGEITAAPPPPLPPPALGNLTNVFPVPVHTEPSLERFVRLVGAGEPFLVRGALSHWPALTRWDPRYFSELHGDRTVPVEVGESYTADTWTQTLMTLRDFMEGYVLSGSQGTGYLAQFDLFHHIPSLRADITALDHVGAVAAPGSIVEQCWFGPAGTVSPLHHDTYQNFFCQVHGRKRFVMFDRREGMRAHESHLLSNTSRVDVEREVVGERAWVTEVGPGEALYIPLHWWHHVRSLSVSFSVSVWWRDEATGDG